MSDYPQPIAPVDHVEPVPRRIRATIAGRTVLDTTGARYLWEWPFYPQYLIPAGDIDPAVVTEAPQTRRLKRGTVTKIGLHAGDEHRPDAGWRYEDSPIDGLAGMVRFDWDAFDAWFEEDEEVFVHPRNPYVRVDALRSSRSVRIESGGVTLAQSTAPVLVFETGLPTRYYFDRADVDFTRLRPSATQTPCPYKGRTSGYWSAVIGEEEITDVAWAYDFPTGALLPIAGLIAFYDEKLDVFVDGERQERPKTHFVKD